MRPTHWLNACGTNISSESTPSRTRATNIVNNLVHLAPDPRHLGSEPTNRTKSTQQEMHVTQPCNKILHVDIYIHQCETPLRPLIIHICNIQIMQSKQQYTLLSQIILCIHINITDKISIKEHNPQTNNHILGSKVFL